MSIPAGLKFAKTHEWVRVEGAEAVVGISDHAQRELTDIVYVELPAVGAAVEAGHPCAVVESVKAASDIYAPVSGQVTATNADLAEHPELVNQDAFGKGWMFKLKLRDPKELGALLSAVDYGKQVGE